MLSAKRALICVAGLSAVACSGGDTSPSPTPTDAAQPTPTASEAPTATASPTPVPARYGVPLAQDSWWPKFRRDAAQTALMPLAMSDDGRDMWTLPTAKGIFSSPVIGGDGTVYIGSGDRHFYAISPEGDVQWSVETGEIIDSAALLDDEGTLYFGSGDGYLRARQASDGAEVWSLLADDPEVNNAYIRWWEANVSIGMNGDLYAGNDNFFVYGVDRADGDVAWRFKMADQTWSLAAVDEDTGNLYIGNNNLLEPLGGNVYAISPAGELLWDQFALGTIAASPLLTPGGLVVVGGFDGYLRAFDKDSGEEVWTFATRDHIYASPALTPDGFIVQPSADGTVYGINAETGASLWAFDWGATIRSSPAVDGNGHIYMGTGDGHLLVLNSDGTLRWALEVIEVDRDDLNSSPGLSPHAVYIAGESGDIFGIPMDFCLRADQAQNAACTLGPDEPLPADASGMLFTTNFGSPLRQAPETIAANQALAFTLEVREGGETTLAFIDTDAFEASVEPEAAFTVEVSADRRFVTVVPETVFEGDEGGQVTLTLSGTWLEDANREGLAFSGGTAAGTFNNAFTFTLWEGTGDASPLKVPTAPGEDSTVMELHRMAVPLPTLMPSYNQIGFDSLHYLVGMVEGDANRAIGWVVEGAPTGPGGETEIVPNGGGIFPVEVTYDRGAMTIAVTDSFAFEVLGTSIGLDTFRIATTADASGPSAEAGNVSGGTLCANIPFYGLFMRTLGLCNPDTDALVAYGAMLVRNHGAGVVEAPAGLGDVSFSVGPARLTATFEGSSLRPDAHNLAILLVDEATGLAVPMDYGLNLNRTAHGDGTVNTVALTLERGALPASARAYLMVDTYPAYVETVSF